MVGLPTSSASSVADIGMHPGTGTGPHGQTLLRFRISYKHARDYFINKSYAKLFSSYRAWDVSVDPEWLVHIISR